MHYIWSHAVYLGFASELACIGQNEHIHFFVHTALSNFAIVHKPWINTMCTVIFSEK